MDTMTESYGKKITTALRAVRQLHGDTSKLLVDYDKKRFTEGCYSVFENNATRELTYNVKAQYWMAQYVYRYYAKKSTPGLVEGLTVCFFRENIDEPILATAQIQYRLAGDTLPCDAWDIWYLFFEPPGMCKPLGKVHTCHKGEFVRDTVDWGKVLATPLFSIKRVEDVEQMLEQVRQTSV